MSKITLTRTNNKVILLTKVILPDAPLSLTATGVSETEIDLTWSSDYDISIERSVDGITYVEIDDVEAGIETYSDISLDYSTTYHPAGSATAFSATGYTKEIGRRSAGDGQYFDGDMVALIQYNTNLSNDDLLLVEKYLSDKYNVSLDTENTKADFSIVGIPDTQDYTADATGQLIVNAMTQFIADKMVGAKIGVGFHVGDVTLISAEDRWNRWFTAMEAYPLASLPYIGALGNHDYDGGSCTRTNTTAWDGRFPTTFYTSKAWWDGGFYETGKTQNIYFNITLGGQDYMFIVLEFGPRQGAIDWANALIQANPTKKVIIIVHAYLDDDGTRLGTGDYYNPHTLVTPDVDVHDGDELWDELISLAANDNIIQVWCGHMTGFLHTASVGDGGNTILEILDAHPSTAYKTGALMMSSFYLTDNRVLLLAHNPSTGMAFYRKMIDVS